LKERRIESALVKVHNILVIYQSLEKLVVHGGYRNEIIVCEQKSLDPVGLSVNFLDLTFLW